MVMLLLVMLLLVRLLLVKLLIEMLVQLVLLLLVMLLTYGTAGCSAWPTFGSTTDAAGNNAIFTGSIGAFNSYASACSNEAENARTNAASNDPWNCE